jgi:hypothetical protein
VALSDILVLGGVVVGTALFFLWHRSVHARGRQLVAATWLGFFGLLLVISMFAHSIEVLAHVFRRDVALTGDPRAYDFRTYSLLLLGGVLIVIGAGVLRAAADVGRGRTGGRAHATRRTVAALAVVLPLIPIQAFFGILVSALAGVTLFVLAATHQPGR